MKFKEFLTELKLPTIGDLDQADKRSMLQAYKERPEYLKDTSMEDWLDYDKVGQLKMSPEEHQKEARRLETEYPNPCTPPGRIAHALARVHRKTAGGKIFKKVNKR